MSVVQGPRASWSTMTFSFDWAEEGAARIDPQNRGAEGLAARTGDQVLVAHRALRVHHVEDIHEQLDCRTSDATVVLCPQVNLAPRGVLE